MQKILNFFRKISIFKKILLGLGILFLGFLIFRNIFLFNKSNNLQYQTQSVFKGNLVVSVSGTGTVLSNNYSKINTLASGVVKKIYVKDGQVVNQGDLIAEIELDNDGKRQFNQAYTNYLAAQNSLQQAKDALYSAQNDLFTKWQSYFNLAQSDRYMGSDNKPKTEERNNSLEFLKTQNDWYAAESTYKLKEKTIKQAEVSLTNAWLSYQQSSPYIYAQISGTVIGLILQPGMIISSSNNNSSNTPIQLGYIKTTAKPIIAVNLTEVDIPKVKINDKAIIEFDAIKDKTFTGKVYSIDLSGNNNSGVVNYSVYVVLDDDSKEILSNMTATVNIIVDIKNDVLIIPNIAIKENNDGEKTVQILKNNKPETLVIKTGLSNDENTEVISGLKEGDKVITNIIDKSKKQSINSNTQRSFSSFGGFSSGGNLRIR